MFPLGLSLFVFDVRVCLTWPLSPVHKKVCLSVITRGLPAYSSYVHEEGRTISTFGVDGLAVTESAVEWPN